MLLCKPTWSPTRRFLVKDIPLHFFMQDSSYFLRGPVFGLHADLVLFSTLASPCAFDKYPGYVGVGWAAVYVFIWGRPHSVI